VGNGTSKLNSVAGNRRGFALLGQSVLSTSYAFPFLFLFARRVLDLVVILIASWVQISGDLVRSFFPSFPP